MEPLVSVIIPYYKGERHIAETLDSVLGQKYPNIEIIVVSDGSPRETLEALTPYRDTIVFIEQENRGQAAARNTGIKAARGAFIALLDQDDAWPVGRLADTVTELSDPTCDFVRGNTEWFSVHENGKKEYGAPVFQEALMGSALYRRSVFDKAGMLDPNMREGEDFDWNIRLRESGCREKRINRTTLWYRDHESNHSKTAGFIKNGQFASLRNKLARAREKKT